MRSALLLAFAVLVLALPASAANPLPMEVTFKNRARFDQLVAQAEPWKALPLGDRTVTVGRALCGIPYKGSTL